ncbi:MAG: PHB depolymerase family esterase [Bacteroidota bacterium]|nr:PHB depolymerase family esterase [Bacteroidota bacterium]
MKKLLLILLFSQLFTKAQQTINSSIMHNNLQGDYILYVPAIYNSNNSTPLVFNFHGYTSNANDQMWYGDFRLLADTANFIIVHPMGTVDNTGTTHWNVGWGTSTVDDVGFTAALIDSLSVNYNIDDNRIYSTGMSNGGFMSYHLACNLSDRIAAIASVTGSMSSFTYSTCNPSHPTPIMEIHGTADLVVDYSSIPNVLDYWIDYNDCNTQGSWITIPDINIMDGSTAEHWVWNMGLNDVTVEHYKIINGAHTWPGTVFASAGTNYDIDASTEIWKFFSQYDINGLIGTSTLINDKTTKNKNLVKITDILGRETKGINNATSFYIYDDGTVEKKIIIK